MPGFGSVGRLPLSAMLSRSCSAIDCTLGFMVALVMGIIGADGGGASSTGMLTPFDGPSTGILTPRTGVAAAVCAGADIGVGASCGNTPNLSSTQSATLPFGCIPTIFLSPSIYPDGIEGTEE